MLDCSDDSVLIKIWLMNTRSEWAFQLDKIDVEKLCQTVSATTVALLA